MKLVDILVLGTSAERRAGSNPAEGNIKSLAAELAREFKLWYFAKNTKVVFC